MYHDFIAERIFQLRQKKGVSAREASLSLGCAPNYCNSLENRKALPSMENFLNLCDFFGITPQEFFDAEKDNPEKINKIVDHLMGKDDEVLDIILCLAKRL